MTKQVSDDLQFEGTWYMLGPIDPWVDSPLELLFYSAEKRIQIQVQDFSAHIPSITKSAYAALTRRLSSASTVQSIGGRRRLQQPAPFQFGAHLVVALTVNWIMPHHLDAGQQD